jgi:steroid 5-alpha reductase family enzyme
MFELETAALISVIQKSIGPASIVMFVIMTIAYAISEKLKNAGLIDWVWGFSFGLLAAIYCATENGALERKIILLIIVLPWSLRLGSYLLMRWWKEFPTEDKRYHAWRVEWGKSAALNMVGVFYLQGALIIILSVPFALIAADPGGTLTVMDLLGIIAALTGFAGESIADEQLRRFKSNSGNKGKTMMSGLWAYSRHPNYFFESVVWIGIFLVALHAPNGFLSVYVPLLMLILLLKVSGVTLTEQHALKDKGEEYLRYIERVSPFIPWFPKKAREGK